MKNRAIIIAAILALSGCAADREARAAEDLANFQERMETLEERARAGDVKAQLELASRAFHGVGVPEDPRAAAVWYLRAAEAGSSDARFAIGLMYEEGKGVPEAPERAAHWYALAAKQGDVRAQTNLGLMYANGRGIERDTEQARAYLGAAAELGHPPAQFAYGSLLANGVGGTVDTSAGLLWIERAAESGIAEAQRTMALAYAQGLGVPADPELSRAWLERAAGSGDGPAAFHLADRLLEAEDDAELPRAIRLLGIAAERQVPEAMYALAVLHARGRGVQKDAEVARGWLERAAALGHRVAGDRLEAMQR